MSLPADSLWPDLAVHDGLPNPQRLLAFLALAMATAMAVLDGAIVNVALPTVARGFAITPANSVWIVNAFQLAVTVSLLPLAALGDTLGYRRVYWPGLALFTAASLACALAPNFGALTVARAVQGFGAAGIMSVNIALVRFIYPASRARTRRRQHGGRRRRVFGGKPERRGGHSVRRLVALALSHQCPDRRGGAADGPSIPARHAALRARRSIP